MRKGFTLGRLYGIRIRIDWSWLLIFILLAWQLSSAFGGIHPDWTIALRWSMALIASLLFFLSVLAHELAHSLVALRQGVAWLLIIAGIAMVFGLSLPIFGTGLGGL